LLTSTQPKLENRDLQLGILVDSEIFVRGLYDAVSNYAPGTIDVRVLTPGVAEREISRGVIDVLILDNKLRSSVITALCETSKSPKVIVVSDQSHAGLTLGKDKDNLCGFFPARAPARDLDCLLNSILECHTQPGSKRRCMECPISCTLEPRKLSLSRREAEIFELIGRLYSNKDIANELSISVKTVEAHFTNIRRKLNLNNSREVLKRAILWVEGR